jgi:hypothetical protein
LHLFWNGGVAHCGTPASAKSPADFPSRNGTANGRVVQCTQLGDWKRSSWPGIDRDGHRCTVGVLPRVSWERTAKTKKMSALDDISIGSCLKVTCQIMSIGATRASASCRLMMLRAGLDRSREDNPILPSVSLSRGAFRLLTAIIFFSHNKPVGIMRSVCLLL